MHISMHATNALTSNRLHKQSDYTDALQEFHRKLIFVQNSKLDACKCSKTAQPIPTLLTAEGRRQRQVIAKFKHSGFILAAETLSAAGDDQPRSAEREQDFFFVRRSHSSVTLVK